VVESNRSHAGSGRPSVSRASTEIRPPSGTDSTKDDIGSSTLRTAPPPTTTPSGSSCGTTCSVGAGVLAGPATGAGAGAGGGSATARVPASTAVGRGCDRLSSTTPAGEPVKKPAWVGGAGGGGGGGAGGSGGGTGAGGGGTGTGTSGGGTLAATVSVKLLDAVVPLPSVAVTRTVRSPTLAKAGEPEKVRVAVSKLSQAGSAAPLASVALKRSVSPTSTSVKVLAGTVKLKALGSVTDCAAMAVAVGASLVLTTVSVKLLDALALLPSVAVTFTVMAPTSPLAGVPLKVRVATLKLSQPGSAEPLASVAL